MGSDKSPFKNDAHKGSLVSPDGSALGVSLVLGFMLIFAYGFNASNKIAFDSSK